MLFLGAIALTPLAVTLSLKSWRISTELHSINSYPLTRQLGC